MTAVGVQAGRRRWWLRPGGILVAAYLIAILIGTLLLLLPIARQGPGGAPPLTAAFTATSVVCVTGLAVVDTAEYWTGFGHVVILALAEIGGIGVMTATSLIVLRISHRLSLRQRLYMTEETRSYGPGGIRGIFLGVLATAIVTQALVALALALRFWLHYDYPPLYSVWLGVFHAATAFNNVGYSLFSNNLMGFVADWWIIIPICVGILIGGIGLPVLREVRDHVSLRWQRIRDRRRTRDARLAAPRRPVRWTIHSRMMLLGTAVLLVGGAGLFYLVEGSNPATLGPLNPAGKLLGSIGLAVFPRTAGFNSVLPSALHEESLFITDILMYIGGGTASTAGGLKITTVGVLIAIAVTEIRGNKTTRIWDRTIPSPVLRSAVAISSVYVAVVIAATMLLLLLTPFGLSAVLVEVISALSTVGFSVGITGDLGGVSQGVLMLLMFAGRIGPVTLAAALAMTHNPDHYVMPEERPYIG